MVGTSWCRPRLPGFSREHGRTARLCIRRGARMMSNVLEDTGTNVLVANGVTSRLCRAGRAMSKTPSGSPIYSAMG